MAQKMLVTRCPDCQTSFRITVATLQEADGRVRCGRCETVFSAFNSLTDTRNDLKALGAEEITLETAPRSRSVVGSYHATLAAIEAAEDEAQIPAEEAPAAEPVAELEAPEIVEDPISEREVDSVLAATDVTEPAPPWTARRRVPGAKPPRIWIGAALAATIVLLAQLTHHFRGVLVAQPFIGTPLAAVYARLGVPTEPSSDPTDFEIVDWLATAGTGDERPPRLHISAGIRNRSSKAEPAPLLFLKLTDRFGNPIGMRYFEPSEYLDAASAEGLLPAGSTATARLDLVDPGPQAFGFEVDTCVRLDAAALRCKSDLVFE
jgi:predicted Zn finger-like uncharacterized protein